MPKPAPANEFFDIDWQKLDTQWREQPRLYYEHAVKAADARAAVDRAKAKLELVEADEYLRIRAAPEEFGLSDGSKAPTEAALKSKVLSRRRYKEALEEYIVAKHEKDVMDAAVSALEHKKRGLEKTTELFLAAYFGEPRLHGESKRAKEQHDHDRAFKRRKTP